MSLSVRNDSRPGRLAFGTRLLAVVVSYELMAYVLAGLQATGFMLAAVGSSPVDVQPGQTCALNMDQIVLTSAQWRSAQRQAHRHPTMEELAVLSPHSWSCPEGGHYEVVGPEERLGDGTPVLPDRIAVRCRGASRDHGFRIENPFPAGGGPKELGWGGSQVIVDGTQAPMATALDTPPTSGTAVRRSNRAL